MKRNILSHIIPGIKSLAVERLVFGVLATMLAVALVLVISAVFPATVQAQAYKTSFVRVAPGAGPALLYEPVPPGPKSHVGILFMHDTSDSLDSLHAVELAKRGYRVLAANTRFPSDYILDWDEALLDVSRAVKFLRSLSGITKLVLFGGSSGACLMSAYQNIAENGLSACQGPEKIVKCSDRLAGMPKADGLILRDPIIGVGANVLTSVDPSLVDTDEAYEENTSKIDPRLDMYNPKNGFDPNGATYSDHFRRRFLARQAIENNELIHLALHRLEKIMAGRGNYTDDEPFIVPGATRTGKLYRPDLHLLSHTRKAYPLLRADGSIVTQVIHSVRVPSGTTPTSQLFNGGALSNSVRRFLNTFATRATAHYDITEDNMTGIDWGSSYNSTPGNVEGVSVPLLILGMTGHYWIVSGEIAFEHASSHDKSVAFVEGASHGITPCTACEQYPGQFGDTVKRAFDYIDTWLSSRF